MVALENCKWICKCGAEYKFICDDGMHFKCSKCGEPYGKSPAVPYSSARKKFNAKPFTAWPYAAKLIERKYHKSGDEGVGDSFEHLTVKIGAKAAAEFLKKFGFRCGCGVRKKWMNAIYCYDGEDGRPEFS